MKVLRLGDTGEEVERWQNFLIGQKFLIGSADGNFGPKTAASTKLFQQHNGLVADGNVGRATIAVAIIHGFGEIEDADDSKSSENWPPPPSFKPLVNTADRQKLFGSFAFKASPTETCPEAITILDGWGDKNVVSVQIPQLIGVQGASKKGTVQFHRAVADQLSELWKAWEEAGLLQYVRSWAGSYSPRFIRGSKTFLSNHAFATAFDINAQWNALGVRPALVGQMGSVRELVSIANEHGFYWGGHYGSKRWDGMHFEVAVIK